MKVKHIDEETISQANRILKKNYTLMMNEFYSAGVSADAAYYLSLFTLISKMVRGMQRSNPSIMESDPFKVIKEDFHIMIEKMLDTVHADLTK